MSLQSDFHWLIGDVPLVQEGTELIHLRNGLGQGQPASPQPIPARERPVTESLRTAPRGASLSTLCPERLAPALAQTCHYHHFRDLTGNLVISEEGKLEHTGSPFCS